MLAGVRRMVWLWALTGAACSSEAAAPAGYVFEGWETSRRHESRSDEPIEPLPRQWAADASLAALGGALFASPLLSEDGRVSCATCHARERGLADGQAVSGSPERPGPPFNSPTLYNVRYLFKLNWTGKFDALPEHLDSLVESPRVLGTTWGALVERLRARGEWRQAFEDVFERAPTEQDVRRALVEYQLSLVTPDAPFDRWLRGEERAIDADARQGYEHFKNYGCSSCHQGMLVGGNMFQRLGVVRPYSDAATELERGEGGGQENPAPPVQRPVYRVPSLRNVALTAPYLHDGSAPTLDVVVRIMAEYQLGRSIEPDHVDQLIAFLRSLTGQPGAAPP